MRRFISVLAAALFAAALSLSATPASAASGGDYCAARIEPLGSEVPQTAPACFQTQAEVDRFLEQVTSPSGARLAASSVVIGAVYKDSNYGGGSYTFYGTGSCAGATYGFPSLDASWQNTVSSAKGYASCWVTLYDSTSYSGERYNCTPNCAGVGTMNDRTESVVFRPTGTLG